MFKINPASNQITSLQAKKFSELGFREREHLQEWIANLPSCLGEELFFSIDQIIPTKDTEEFMIGLADKAQDEIIGVTQEKNRHIVRRKFWAEIISAMNKKSTLYNNISAGKSSWIAAGSGISGVLFSFGATKSYCSVEIYIDRGDIEENEFIFNHLFEQKEKIEEAFGEELAWERLDGKRAYKIKMEQNGNIYESEQWSDMIEFMVDAMVRLENAMRDPLKEIKQQLKK